MRLKAREEEKLEVENLLNLPQPPVPKGWDYLILPRKINLERVPKPPTIMQEDYFAPVKELVRFYLLKFSIETSSESSWNCLRICPCSYYTHVNPYWSLGIQMGRKYHLVCCWSR